MSINKFYSVNQDQCCFGMAVGRVPLRIIGGVCVGLGLIQVLSHHLQTMTYLLS